MTATYTSVQANTYSFKIKDTHSAISHFIGFVGAIVLTPLLLVKASAGGASTLDMVWYSLFMLSIILLYGASTAYHTFDCTPKVNAALKRMDHAMIFVMIAGSYTPVCMIGLRSKAGTILCITVWTIAIVGTLIKMFWIYCPKWFSSVLYIALGWACVFEFETIYKSIPHLGFAFLLIGGIIYTIGGLVYPLKIKGLKRGYGRDFGMHEIFHICILFGSLFHYLMMYVVLTAM